MCAIKDIKFNTYCYRVDLDTKRCNFCYKSEGYIMCWTTKEQANEFLYKGQLLGYLDKNDSLNTFQVVEV